MEWEAVAAIPVDVDADGVDELYYIQENTVTLARQTRGQHLWQRGNAFPSELEYGVPVVADITGDEIPEVLVTGTMPESLLVYVEDLVSGGVRRILVDSGGIVPGYDWDQSFGASVFADLNGDGVADMIFGVNSGYSCAPRGIYAVDGRTGERMWRFGTGANIGTLEATDIDDDGYPEVFVGTHAPGNGCEESGTDDFHNYVLCLDRFGKLKWMNTLRAVPAGGVVKARASDLDNDSVLDMVVLDRCGIVQTEPDRLYVLNPIDGSIKRSITMDSAEVGFKDLIVDDLDGDGRPEIVTVDSRGLVEVRDRMLKVIRSKEFEDEIGSIVACDHLLGTGQKQLLVLSQANEMLILDHCLKILARSALPSQPRDIFPVATGEGQPKRLLVHSFKLTNPETLERALWLFRIIILPRPFPWHVVSGALAAVLLLGGVFLIYTRRSYREQIRYFARGLVQKAGIVELDRRGRVTSANDYARELLGIGKESKTTDIREFLSGQEFRSLQDALERVIAGKDKQASCELALKREGTVKSYLAKVSRMRFGGYLLSLEDLSAVEYARRVAAWGPVAQRLAHGIKTPLSTIRLTAQQLEEEGDSETGKVIQEEVDRLSKMTDGFMRLANFEPLKFESKDLNRIVERVLEEQGVEMQPELEVNLQLRAGLPSVRVDEEQIARALANLVNNAVSAMKGKGVLTIATRLAEGDKRIEIAVSDTGPGIPEAYLPKLFLPFFTRKPGGTGLGLSIVKKVVEDHGGSVEVESKVGEGTTFRVFLPVARGLA